MSDELKSLRESMNRTILKHGKMSVADKEKLYTVVIQDKKVKNRFSLAPALSFVAVACFIVFLGGYVFKQSGNIDTNRNQVGQVNDKVVDETTSTSKQENQQVPNLASFLYELNLKLRNPDMWYQNGKEYAQEVGEYAESNSTQFAAIQQEKTIVDKLEEIGKLSKNLQQAAQNEIEEDTLNLERAVNQLIMIAEDYGIVDERNDIIEKLEFSDMKSWLVSTKDSMHAETYEPYSDLGAYEKHIGYVTKAYAKHYAALEGESAIKEQLKEIAEVAEQIENEKEKEKRTEWLNQLDGMVDILLQDKKVKKKGDVREMVWKQLSAEQKEWINGTWEDGEISKITLTENMMSQVDDKSYEGKEVYLLDFPTKSKSIPNNMIIYADINTFAYIGDGLVD
ncbi:hypothetical protein [Niallia sp. FSL W8-0635]|uniref:hypothetical protein n=1 Tax=Niallia sp. FSL W8-0635 TaxID=2975337 RepID=UPI0009D07C76|nr:Uncharacterised protein [Mycobacteroides abscessus subsp. abscessus]HEO8418436.1 hypothetical protein [Yersinia enterocolitica]